MARQGYIPNDVHFYNKPLQKMSAQSGYSWWRRNRLAVECIPSFPVHGRCKEDAATRDNASRWAFDEIWERRPGHKPGKRLPSVILPNTPKSGYRLIGAEQRGEGGRAWKVVSPEGYLVDMREDVFMPILLSKGLPKSGLIDAEFQWCINGSQMRLEQVGSTAFKLYVTEDVKFSKDGKVIKPKRLPAKDIKVGGVYRTNDYFRVFMGRVQHAGKKKWAWLEIGYAGYGAVYSLIDPQAKLNSKITQPHFTVTNSANVLEHMGDVKLSDTKIAEGRAQWSDGYGMLFGGPCDRGGKIPIWV